MQNTQLNQNSLNLTPRAHGSPRVSTATSKNVRPVTLTITNEEKVIIKRVKEFIRSFIMAHSEVRKFDLTNLTQDSQSVATTPISTPSNTPTKLDSFEESPKQPKIKIYKGTIDQVLNQYFTIDSTKFDIVSNELFILFKENYIIKIQIQILRLLLIVSTHR